MGRLLLEPHLREREGDVCSWIEWNTTDSRSRHEHTHHFRELFWILDGRGVHFCNHRQFALVPRMLVLVHQDDLHTLAAQAGEHLHFINLAFPLQAWQYLRRRYWRAEPDPFAADDARKHLLLEESRWAEFLSFTGELQSGRRDRAALERFLLNLHYLIEQPKPAAGEGLPGWLRDGLAALRSDLHWQQGIAALVNYCGRSREHVSRSCRRYLGRSLTELVNDIRLQRAAVELAQTDHKISAVAAQNGFRHLGHFYRQFATRYRMTPRQYRLRQQRIVR